MSSEAAGRVRRGMATVRQLGSESRLWSDAALPQVRARHIDSMTAVSTALADAADEHADAVDALSMEVMAVEENSAVIVSLCEDADAQVAESTTSISAARHHEQRAVETRGEASRHLATALEHLARAEGASADDLGRQVEQRYVAQIKRDTRVAMEKAAAVARLEVLGPTLAEQAVGQMVNNDAIGDAVKSVAEKLIDLKNDPVVQAKFGELTRAIGARFGRKS
ncbi:MAG: hypothetical protein QM621_00230 [Aeromicrobium sp.]|uniref:hypothetical protein n=1 Tax=Aeromicrobium sp. TaxID=1871063 RepID=UPI0039E241E2